MDDVGFTGFFGFQFITLERQILTTLIAFDRLKT